MTRLAQFCSYDSELQTVEYNLRRYSIPAMYMYDKYYKELEVL